MIPIKKHSPIELKGGLVSCLVGGLDSFSLHPLPLQALRVLFRWAIPQMDQRKFPSLHSILRAICRLLHWSLPVTSRCPSNIYGQRQMRFPRVRLSPADGTVVPTAILSLTTSAVLFKFLLFPRTRRSILQDHALPSFI